MLRAIKMQLIKLKHQYKIILAMIGLTLLMIFLFSGGQGGNYLEKVGVVDESKSDLSKSFMDSLESSNQYDFIEIAENEGIQKMKNSEMIAMIRIPKNLENDLLNKKEITIPISSIKSDVSTRLLENDVKNSIQLTRASEIIVKLINTNFNNEIKDDLIRDNYNKHWLYKKPFNLIDESINQEDLNNGLNHSIIGFIILFVSYSIIYGIADVLEDIDLRTWHRMIISPISRNKLILANSLISFLTGFLQIILVFILSDFLFNANFSDNILQVSLVAGLYVFSLTGIGIFVISVVKSFKQIDALTPVILTSMAMLGGCLWPLEIVNSKFLLFLGNLTPHKWAVLGLKKIMISQFGIEDILFEIIVLVVIGISFYSIGLYRINKKVYY